MILEILAARAAARLASNPAFVKTDAQRRAIEHIADDMPLGAPFLEESRAYLGEAARDNAGEALRWRTVLRRFGLGEPGETALEFALARRYLPGIWDVIGQAKEPLTLENIAAWSGTGSRRRTTTKPSRKRRTSSRASCTSRRAQRRTAAAVRGGRAARRLSSRRRRADGQRGGVLPRGVRHGRNGGRAARARSIRADAGAALRTGTARLGAAVRRGRGRGGRPRPPAVRPHRNGAADDGFRRAVQAAGHRPPCVGGAPRADAVSETRRVCASHHARGAGK